MGRQRLNGMRLREGGFRTRCADDCCGNNCAGLAVYDGLTGLVDFDYGVTNPGDDGCCESQFSAVVGGSVAWSAGGGLAGAEYGGELPPNGTAFCGHPSNEWARYASFACSGDGTFQIRLTSDIYNGSGILLYIFEWADTFPEPFQFGVEYTLPFVSHSGGGIGLCNYDGWTYGDAHITFYTPS